MLNKLLANPDIAFVVVATVITILVLLLRLIFKSFVLLWKSTLISYIVFVIFMLIDVVCNHTPHGDAPIYSMVFLTFSMILLLPAMLIYGLFPGTIKMCQSLFDEFALCTIGFFFYVLVIWGIMKFRKKLKEVKTAEQKQGDSFEKQTPSETET